MTKTVKRKRGGRAGMLAYLPYINDNSQILGAGGYGIALKTRTHAIKLFYDTAACAALKEEARIQRTAERLLLGIIKVPHIEAVSSRPFTWKGVQYLCGIAMKAVKAPPEFGGHQLHLLLGYDGSDIDTVWYKDSSKPAGPDNPPRGFFTGPETMEDYWESVGSKWTIESAAYTMGLALGTLIVGGIVPNDLEFVYSKADDELWLIDFGLCRFGQVEPRAFLQARGTEGLASELYIPQEGYRGRAEFLTGFFAATTQQEQQQPPQDSPEAQHTHP